MVTCNRIRSELLGSKSGAYQLDRAGREAPLVQYAEPDGPHLPTLVLFPDGYHVSSPAVGSGQIAEKKSGWDAWKKAFWLSWVVRSKAGLYALEASEGCEPGDD